MSPRNLPSIGCTQPAPPHMPWCSCPRGPSGVLYVFGKPRSRPQQQPSQGVIRAMAGPAFRAAAVRVRVPATSANLGPGFDSLGLSLGLYDDVVVRVADSGLGIDIAGEGAETPAPRREPPARTVPAHRLRPARRPAARPRGRLRQPHPARPRPRLLLRRHLRRHRRRARRDHRRRRPASTTRPCWHSRPRSRATPTTSPPVCSAGSRSPGWTADAARAIRLDPADSRSFRWSSCPARRS